MKHYDIRITGLVQGVSFRQNCRRQADTLGITGWVRNDPDGSVSLAAEGQKKNLDLFMDWCHVGSPYARINQIIVSPGKVKNFTGFEVYY